ncbi:synaptogenesis protein syg-2-like [Macrobrachium nipponense]|uniref:synaptogenesis protein syg-2-like n=1 Tax=Macrobrachium nipponense TaxID=159736 RepID=UPI0030C7E8D4
MMVRFEGRSLASVMIILVVFVIGGSSSVGHTQEIYDDVEEENADEESDPNDEFKNSPMTSSTSVAGETSVLPCNISSDIRGDSVQLVLWYRDNVPTPIYSYDVRSGDYSPPTKWSDPVLLGDRAYFSMTSKPAALVLNQTTRDDQAVYRCRVDYKQFTTTHARVNLTVIEPIRNVKIVDQGGLELVGAAGPYTLGERPTLTCRVQGGDPPPTAVTWWRDGLLLDSTYHHQTPPSVRTSTSAPGGTVVNTIHLRALKKEDLRSLYTCKAANHEKAPTKEVAVEIDMNFGPDTVEVHGLEGPLSSGRAQQLVCEAKGSRPPAIITWWLDGHMKKSVAHMTSLDGVVSSSTLELTVSPTDEGKELTCRAENPELQQPHH